MYCIAHYGITSQRDKSPTLPCRRYRRRFSDLRSLGGGTNSSSETASSMCGSGGRSEILSSICVCFSKYRSFSSRACRSRMRWTMSFFFCSTRYRSSCSSNSLCRSSDHRRYRLDSVSMSLSDTSAAVRSTNRDSCKSMSDNSSDVSTLPAAFSLSVNSCRAIHRLKIASIHRASSK